MIWLGRGLLLTLVVAINLPYVYEEVDQQVVGPDRWSTGQETSVLPAARIQLAGWPMKFFVSASYDELPAVYKWNYQALGLNVALYLAVGLLLAARTYRANARRLASSQEAHSNKRQFDLGDMLLLTAFVAAGVAYWQTLQSRVAADLQLAEKVASQGGSVTRRALLPSPFKSVAEVFGTGVFLRIAEAKLFKPDDALLREVVDLSSLEALHISEGDCSWELLQPLQSHALLRELNITERTLAPQAIDLISGMVQLQKISLMGTDVTAAEVAVLGRLPKLLDLNLIHTKVRLSEFGHPDFSKTLRKLNLPRPAVGQGDSLELNSWPELIELTCDEYEQPSNPEPVSLSISQMPRLASIGLDALQAFELRVDGLPALAEIAPSYRQWQQRASADEFVPDGLWLKKLQLSSVPKLENLVVHAGSLEDIQIDAVALALALTVRNLSISRTVTSSDMITLNERPARVHSPEHHMSAEQLVLAIRQRWIDQLAQARGMRSLDLRGLPLEQVNLTGLSGNPDIEQLDLSGAIITQQQALQLRRMPKLRTLVIQGVRLQGHSVEALVKDLPALRQLVCDHWDVARLRLENAEQIEQLYSEPFEAQRDPLEVPTVYTRNSMIFMGPSRMDALKLVNVPNLRESFSTTGAMQLLQIENAPRLKGLSFNGSLPANAKIAGVRDLVYFAAGGPNCTPEIITEVLSCQQLKRLTLAFTTLNDEHLQLLTALRELETLDLSGTTIPDDAIRSLQSLPRLRRLRLQRCMLTAAVSDTLVKCTQLEQLLIPEIRLPPQQLSQLAATLLQLKHLSIDANGLTKDEMEQLMRMPMLISLKLQNCHLDESLVNAVLASPTKALDVLGLTSCSVDDRAFAKLVKALPNLRFRIVRSDIPPAALDLLIRDGRVAGDGIEADPSFRISRTYGRMVELREEVGDINATLFIPERGVNKARELIESSPNL